ncbi:hypothetical protein [Rubritalea marina]|uniref:hypothetical protein n=1 Tax=Rubritalea marina TaxID=361055 RepID=UPI00036168BC|nr:hypothetical protein [Rubritalea marina]
MSEDVLKQKVQILLTAMETVFHQEWRKTKLNMDHEMIEHFIDAKGSFLQPEGPTTVIPWHSRDALLAAYRSLQEELGESTSGVPLTTRQVVQQPASPISQAQAAAPAQPAKQAPTPPDNEPLADTQSYLDIVNGVGVDDDLSKSAQPSPQNPAPTEQLDDVKKPESAPVEAKTAPEEPAVPKPQMPASENTGSQAIPKPGDVQWPGPMTAPIGIQPAGAGAPGFHNPFAAAVTKKEPKAPASMVGPDTGKPQVKADPATLRAIASKEKFSHLLKDVKHEVVRDFILAEGTHSGTDKPTIIIYTLENIWLDFAFPYEEGHRILNKYPQRDPELIEFMKASGQSE